MIVTPDLVAAIDDADADVVGQEDGEADLTSERLVVGNNAGKNNNTDSTSQGEEEEEEEEILASLAVPTLEGDSSSSMVGNETKPGVVLVPLSERNQTFLLSTNETAADAAGLCFCPCDHVNATTMMMRDREVRNFVLSQEEEEEEDDDDDDSSSMQEDGGGEEEGIISGSDPPAPSDLASETFSRYLRRLRLIYELDIRMLEQLSQLLRGANREVLPRLRETIEPILETLPNTIGAANLDPASLLGLAASAVKGSTIEASVSTTLGNLDFLNIGQHFLTLHTICYYSSITFLGVMSNSLL